MAIREVELPGVGHKYTLTTQSKAQVVMVLHRAGKRELYHFAPEQTVPSDVIELTSEEARQVGAILSQTNFEVSHDTSTELVMKELTIEWLALPDGHQLAGGSLRDAAIRARTGASVIAVLRGGKSVINPDPDEVLQAADTLMVIGNADQVQSFKTLFELPAPAPAGE